MTAAELQAISVELSVNTGDEVSLYSVDGEQFSAAARKNAINEARGKVYDAKLDEFMKNAVSERKAYLEFANTYPEFRKISSNLSVNDSNVANKPDDCRRVLEVKYDHLRPPVKATEIPTGAVGDADKNTYSYHYATTAKPKFWVTEDSIRLLPVDVFLTGGGVIDVIYLAYPVAVELTSSVPDPISWKNDIMVVAENILLKRQQITQG